MYLYQSFKIKLYCNIWRYRFNIEINWQLQDVFQMVSSKDAQLKRVYHQTHNSINLGWGPIRLFHKPNMKHFFMSLGCNDIFSFPLPIGRCQLNGISRLVCLDRHQGISPFELWTLKFNNQHTCTFLLLYNI
jgi:hypothetical protein